MKSVWITGANGLIGNYLVQIAPRFPTSLTPSPDAINFKPT
jgi:hypothetical protein